MAIFNRDYAVVGASGQILQESHSKERCEQALREMNADGLWIGARVARSDRPRGHPLNCAVWIDPRS